eukprot:m51a1_g3810 putative tyrosine protein (169) ;mRNA; f:254425-254985
MHRDLKSENVLVVRLEDAEYVETTVKLVDFGSARFVDDDTQRFYTKGIGTPIYMAPEVIQGSKYSKPADVFSFGVLLWGTQHLKEEQRNSPFIASEILAQRVPFKEIVGGSWKVAQWVTAGNRLAMPIGTPTLVAKLVGECWSQSPAQRPKAQRVAGCLECCLKLLRR